MTFWKNGTFSVDGIGTIIPANDTERMDKIISKQTNDKTDIIITQTNDKKKIKQP
jgi:hypothetical protein